ncbi:MAG TPA: sigma-70 family RNA polymerase sigma factor [Myxococcota bacterium]|nr:sigma-70 family RNA polymerase sigma factor [Myxococcota bacterium]
MTSDEALRVEAARKDPGQFAALYEANFELVYAYLARRVKGRAEIEDLTSEVFRRALSGLSSYESRGAPFSAWLLRIAANALVDRARRAKRRAELAPLEPAPEPSLEDRLDAEERAKLFRSVSELPHEQRRVIELRFADERPIREIAAALGKTEGAVKQLQLRALGALRRKMGTRDG